MSANVYTEAGSTKANFIMTNKLDADLVSELQNCRFGFSTDTKKLVLKDQSGNVFRYSNETLFYTKTDLTNNTTELDLSQLLIGASGTPSKKLQVVTGATDNGIRFGYSDAASFDFTRVYSTGNYLFKSNESGSDLSFELTGSGRAFSFVNGDVNINGTNKNLALSYSNGVSGGFIQGLSSSNEGNIGLRIYDGTNYNMYFTGGGVGIGDYTPNAYFATGLTVNPQVGSSTIGINIVTPGNKSGFLTFAKSSSGTDAYHGYVAYDHSVSTMSLGTGSATKMTIKGGYVGIANTSPQTYLHIGTSGASIQLGDHNTGNGASYIYLTASNLVKNWKISQNDQISGAFEITKSQTNGGEDWETSPSFMIDSTGRVGINTTPTAYLDVNSVVRFRSEIEIVDAGGLTANSYYDSGFKYRANGYSSRISFYNGSTMFFTAPSGTAGGAVTHTERMRVDSSGRIGIGTPSPTALLDVYGGIVSTGGELRLTGYNGNADDSVIYFDNTSNNYIYNNSGVFNWRVGGTDRLTILNDGKVGIGTNTPICDLNIKNPNPMLQLSSSTYSDNNIGVTLSFEDSNGYLKLNSSDSNLFHFIAKSSQTYYNNILSFMQGVGGIPQVFFNLPFISNTYDKEIDFRIYGANTNPRFIINEGKVGINLGVGSVTTQLDVNGITRIRGTNLELPNGSTITSNAYESSGWKRRSTGYSTFQNFSNDKIIFSTTQTSGNADTVAPTYELMRLVGATSRVGILNNDPQETLDVSGRSKARGFVYANETDAGNGGTSGARKSITISDYGRVKVTPEGPTTSFYTMTAPTSVGTTIIVKNTSALYSANVNGNTVPTRTCAMFIYDNVAGSDEWLMINV